MNQEFKDNYFQFQVAIILSIWGGKEEVLVKHKTSFARIFPKRIFR